MQGLDVTTQRWRLFVIAAITNNHTADYSLHFATVSGDDQFVVAVLGVNKRLISRLFFGRNTNTFPGLEPRLSFGAGEGVSWRFGLLCHDNYSTNRRCSFCGASIVMRKKINDTAFYLSRSKSIVSSIST